MHELPTSLLMFIAYRSAETRIHDAVRAAGFSDLTLQQGRLLAAIGPLGSRLSVVAERAQISKQTATALVDKLEAAGYVERVPDPHDRRATLVYLTERSRTLVPVARRVEVEIESEWRDVLGAERMADLHAMLTELRAVTDPTRDRP